MSGAPPSSGGASAGLALSRYHTVLHVLNTIALRDHRALMTGTQIATDHARIDVRIEAFTASLLGGRFVIERSENKGRINERLYVRLVHLRPEMV